LDNLRLSLEGLTVDRLKDLMQVTKIKTSLYRKSELVDILYKFYSNPESPAYLYKQLNAYERELMTCIVQSKYRPIDADIADIAKAHKIEPEKWSYGSGYNWKYVRKGSPLNGFFVDGAVPPLFKAYLEKVTPPYVRRFLPCEIMGDIEDYGEISGREARYRDFDMLLSFVNNNNAAVTKAGGYIGKAALIKFHKTVGYDDLFRGEANSIEEIRNAGETSVSFGMTQLLRCAKVLDIVKDKFVPGDNAAKYAGLSMPAKARFLYEAYIRHGGGIIDECARIFAAKLKFSRSVYNLSGARRVIVSYLKECPVNEWIDFKQLSKELRKAEKDLFEAVGSVLIRDDYYNSYYDSPGWDDFEHCAVSVVLLEYLATLGAVDVLARVTSHSDYDYGSEGYEVSYFRVTDLGAYLFGITETYEPKDSVSVSEGQKGFIVQPNFDVVIPNGNDRMKHELFFDRFAEKTVNDEAVSVYKLDFYGMARALNIGLYIREIGDYCEAFSSQPVPDNVKTAFSEWENQSGRIRVRTVSVIEADDPVLLEELKNYRGMTTVSEGRISPVIILQPNAEKKAKTLIEKNGRFCVLGG